MGEQEPNTLNKKSEDLQPSEITKGPPKEELLLAHLRESGVIYIITKGSVREASQEMLGRELSDEEFDYVLDKFEEYIGWMDWTEYLDEALQSLNKDE